MSNARGFTLLELVTVLLVAGVLLAMAAARLDNGRGVIELGYAENLLDDLRLARQRALLDGCDVRVSVNSAGVTIEQRANLCSGAFDRPVPGAAGSDTPLGGPPPTGLALSASRPAFVFSPGGAALTSAGGTPVDVWIDVGPRRIQIVGATGYASW